MTRQPALLRLVNEERVIGRRRMWGLRLVVLALMLVTLSPGAAQTPAEAAGVFAGTLVGMAFWLTIGYRLLSRPGTDDELADLSRGADEDPRPDTCPSCAMSLPPLVDTCPRCDTPLDETQKTAADG